MAEAIHLSIVIPTYNEERRIGRTLAKIREYMDKQDYSYEVVVSDDGSADTTCAIVNIIQEGWPELRLIKAPSNQGKGAAVKRGILAVRGDNVLFTDADNATPIEELSKLLPFLGEYPIVFGSRHIKGAKICVPQVKHRALLSRLSNLLIRVVAVPGVWDTQCGFKLFKSSVAKNIFANVQLTRFGFDIEAFVIARQLGYTYKEIGIEWYNDFDSRVRAGREALRTLWDLFRIRYFISQGKYKSVGYVQNAYQD